MGDLITCPSCQGWTPDETGWLCLLCDGEGVIWEDCRDDNTGLDDGPFLPGRQPRKRPAAKSEDDTRDIRARAWATRREKYGKHGHR